MRLTARDGCQIFAPGITKKIIYMKSHKINKFFERYAAFLLKWRWVVISLFAVVMVVSFYGMSKMVQQTSFDDYFIEGDSMLAKTEEFKAHFGNDYFVGILTDCQL